MIRLKSKEEITLLREGGRRLAAVLDELANAVAPGVSAFSLDTLARRLIVEGGDKPSFLNYKPYGANRPYPAALCVSVNSEVVHGIPNERPKVLKEGDIVSLDCSLVHKGLITDMAITVGVGTIDKKAKELLMVTAAALQKGIEAALPGNTVGDIGHAIETYIKPYKFGIVRELAGHGVGYKVHEDPYVPNYGKAGEGEKLVPGLVIAIEPMCNEGTQKVILDADGYTYKTADGARSAHFEHTIAITEEGPLVLTAL